MRRTDLIRSIRTVAILLLCAIPILAQQKLTRSVVLVTPMSAPPCPSPAFNPFVFPNMLKNPSFNTVGPSGTSTTWTGPMPFPFPPSAAAEWGAHNSNAGAVISTRMIPSTGPQGPRMLHISTGGNEGGVIQTFSSAHPGSSKVIGAAWVYVRRGNAQIGIHADGVPTVSAMSTKIGEWELLQVCSDGNSTNSMFFVVNQNAKGGDFYVDAAAVVTRDGESREPLPGREPDLTVGLTAPARAKAGSDIGPLVKLTARNIGTATALGTIGSPANGHMIDLVLSKDQNVPAGFATFSAAFVEDALLKGGRTSNTVNLTPLSFKSYPTGAGIPADTPTGSYFLCARIDSGNKIAESDETNNVACVPIKIFKQASHEN
jgi:hypothetical protein